MCRPPSGEPVPGANRLLTTQYFFLACRRRGLEHVWIIYKIDSIHQTSKVRKGVDEDNPEFKIILYALITCLNPYHYRLMGYIQYIKYIDIIQWTQPYKGVPTQHQQIMAFTSLQDDLCRLVAVGSSGSWQLESQNCWFFATVKLSKPGMTSCETFLNNI